MSPPPLLNPPDGCSVIQKLRGDRWTQTRKPNTSRVVWWAVGVWSCGADQRDGQTEGGRDFCGLRDHFESVCISSLTRQNWSITLHITKLMRRRAKLKDSTFPPHTTCMVSLPLFVVAVFHYTWPIGPIPSFPLFCNNGMPAAAPSCFSIVPFHFIPFSLTPQDVITPTDVSLQPSYDNSTQKLHNSGGRIQNWLPKTKHACNFHLKTQPDKQWPHSFFFSPHFLSVIP